MGLLTSRRVGNGLFYTANIAFPVYQELVSIFVKLGTGPE